MINTKINLVTKNIDDLIPYENNPRHNDEAVEPVSESIKANGYKVPIIVDSNNVIITGHTRLKALKKLGVDTVDVIVADDLSDEQVKAFRLIDNKTSELSEWDFVKLEQELGEIDIDMTAFGFIEVDTDYLDDFFNEPAEQPKEEAVKSYKVIIEFEDKSEADAFYQECVERDLNCKLED